MALIVLQTADSNSTKRSALFIGTDNEPLSVAMRVSNPRCSVCTPVVKRGVDLISYVLPFDVVEEKRRTRLTWWLDISTWIPARPPCS